ncbi:hypothetical protein L9F63_015200 [Diploptera punctata]|uniref:Ionotropic glutamate receptor C-terminal domain-containing protein n=1 Tax=Diploptera punctata TaxID=6984 RepID=A0AAD8A6A4_DIPPU|nr:hypothetical protein L9F63_015200 [Diploptera punctata]
MVKLKVFILLYAVQLMCSCYDDVYISGTIASLQRHVGTQSVCFIQFGEQSLHMNLEEYFSKTHIPFNCEFLVAQRKGQIVILTEVYRVALHLPLKLRHFGTWRKDLANFTSINFQDRRRSMDGHVLQAFTVHFPPFTSVIRNGSQVILGGAFGEIWNEIQHLANFTCNTTVLPQIMFGMLTNNGSWSGMVGMLDRSEADVVIASFTMTSARTSAVSFTKPILNTRYCMMIGELETVGLLKYFSPFNWNLWLAIVCSILVFSTLLNVLFRVYEKSTSRPYCESLFIVTYTYCMQGGMINTKTWPIRMIQLMMYAVAFIIMTAYSGALISYLTVQQTTLPFNTFQELLDKGEYKVGVKDTTAEFSNMMDVNNTMLHAVYKKLLLPDPENVVQTNTQGIRRMCSIKFAFWGTTEPVLEKANNMNLCSVLIVPGCCTRSTMAIALRKDSPYSFIIRHAMLPLLYNGVLNRATKMVEKPKEVQENKSTYPNVNLKKVAPLLMLLSIGFIMSAVILVIERHNHRHSINKIQVAKIRKTL